MTTNERMRIMANNLVDAAATTMTYSSQLAAYPMSNLQNAARSRASRFGGNFTVDATKNKLYLNDGSDLTATITAGDYTYATLATAVAAALNAVSSGWSCTYDLAGETFKFTVSRSTSGTLRLSQTTNAAWDMLGFTGTTDRTGTTFAADVIRCHTEEWVKWDFTLAQPLDFFAAIGRIDEVFGLSGSASARFQANNVDLWTSPPLDVALTLHDDGLMRFMDDQASTSYRYARLLIEDRTNTAGPESFEIGRIYVGDYDTFASTNVGQGFIVTRVDPSEVLTAESGALMFRDRPKYRSFSGMTVDQVPAAERAAMDAIYREVGLSKPLFVSLDPTVFFAHDLQDMTAYVRFAVDPSWTNVYQGYFQQSLELREVV